MPQNCTFSALAENVLHKVTMTMFSVSIFWQAIWTHLAAENAYNCRHLAAPVVVYCCNLDPVEQLDTEKQYIHGLTQARKEDTMTGGETAEIARNPA